MDHINTLFGPRPKATRSDKSPQETERGQLMKYFLGQLNPSRKAIGMKPYSYPRLGAKLEGIPTKDLYYIKRVCDDAPVWGKMFHYILDPKKHPDGQPIDVRNV